VLREGTICNSRHFFDPERLPVLIEDRTVETVSLQTTSIEGAPFGATRELEEEDRSPIEAPAERLNLPGLRAVSVTGAPAKCAPAHDLDDGPALDRLGDEESGETPEFSGAIKTRLLQFRIGLVAVTACNSAAVCTFQ
jgi:hypothetical protein